REILQKKDERKVKLQTSLDLIINQLKNLGVLKIIIFGSFAKGDVDVNSDLDLFVLMPSPRTGKEWMDIIYEKIDRKVASDIIVFNEEELKEKLPSSSFLQSITKGKVVYEKTA
ncbi:MAG: nucleotidyltransferase domain-containing protein, partial [Deltaproteobacteria bacterium]|nr:nucleotidyltransferase domain-containing protein [Deltaproteobacteria bacterium]